MKPKVNAYELAPLADFINRDYQGSLSDISNDLNKAIYLLHYLDKDDVEERERHEVCYTIYHVSQKLLASRKGQQETGAATGN